jgi:hypothetical protein
LQAPRLLVLSGRLFQGLRFGAGLLLNYFARLGLIL